MQVGTEFLKDGRIRFRVWAPLPEEVALKIHGDPDIVHPMEQEARGYWSVTLEDVAPGARYTYRLDGETSRPDPASHAQPDGVHGPSAVVRHDQYPWGDTDWQSYALPEMVFYELHVGTFTPEGTFRAIIPRLKALRELGVNALELMPVGQFPGERNWGYDGVYPYAVQDSYGGPEGLKDLVNACHRTGMAVVLDVVYNHLGPEGNYLRDFGPYFTDKYHTPWGEAVNFDAAHSDEVRNYFIENARYWCREYHLDGLRLDAVHAIFDLSAVPFLRELAASVESLEEELGRPLYLFPESDLNDARLLRPRDEGGCQLDAQWSDDFHHAVHTLLTGEQDGYYLDFGAMDDLVRAIRNGYAYDWRYSAFRRRRHGNSSADRPAHQFIVYTQNHDQVGNRMRGERLSGLVPFEALKLAAGLLMLAPNLPLIFMGQEYGEEAPFLYFVSHSDPDLIRAVRQGRREEFESFSWEGEPPDPQSPDTFRESVLHWDVRDTDRHGTLRAFYRRLMELRRTVPALASLDKQALEVTGNEATRVLALRRWTDADQVVVWCNFHEEPQAVTPAIPAGTWRRVLHSASAGWDGPGDDLPESIDASTALTLSPLSVTLYRKEPAV